MDNAIEFFYSDTHAKYYNYLPIIKFTPDLHAMMQEVVFLYK